MESRLRLEIGAQPDDTTCGPTCLQAVYRYYGDELPLSKLLREVSNLESGGTLAVHLACHALARGYRATIYTYNLHLFDPSWFRAPGADLAARLRTQAVAKADAKLRDATEAYLAFLARGGRIRHEELRPALLRRYLKRDRPILTGLSATYLYDCERETGDFVMEYDDVGGVPQGHFVVLCGYDAPTRRVAVADPLRDNPRFGVQRYEVDIDRVTGAILLGVLTYDANFLILEPGGGRRR